MNSKSTINWCKSLLTLSALFLFTLFSNSAIGQTCTTPPNNLVNGNFDLPVTALNLAGNNTSDNIEINNNLTAWFVSHGHPTTQSLPNRNMWMWSYGGNGEGIFNCFNFVQGQSYLICFDLQTNGKANGATVNVKAANNLTASTTGNGVPNVPEEVIWSDLVANYSYNNWTQIGVVYTPSANYSSIWFHPFWSGAGGSGTPAPQGNPGQSEMRIDNVSITLLPDSTCPCDITAGYTFSDSSCTVDFTDASSSNCCTDIIGWFWDFGDGTTGTGQNPSHTYPASGTYDACLTIVGYNGDGECCTDSVCMPITVDCGDSCVCDMETNFSWSAEGCDVIFRDLTTHDSCVTITDWSWDFGDGGTSNQQNPVYNYGASGTYTVCLTTTGTNGSTTCVSDTCFEVTVDCDTCTCSITAAFVWGETAPCEVTFGDMSTNSPCTNIIGWDWDFGDGSTSNVQNPVHTYPGPGSYVVCFTVYGHDGVNGCKDTYCTTIDVACDPDARFKSTPGGIPIELDIFPNPTSGDVFIEFDNSQNLEVNVDVLSSTGQWIKRLATDSNEAKTTLKWSPKNEGLATGVYYIRVQTGDKIRYEKILFED